MEDMSPKLLEQVQQTFSENFRKNKKISEIYKKIRSGSGTFRDAQEFARETGKALSDAYSSVIHGEDLPNGKMYYNIAQKVLQPTLSENFALATKVAGMVQESLNEQAGIGMKAVQPDLNQDRIDGILNRVSSEDNFDDVKWILGAPVETFTQSAVDDEIRVNAEFQSKSGMRPKIVRTMVGNCCPWCKAMAGTYYYPDVPKDVFRRHNNCNCIVEYFPGDGKVQNAHSKVWYREEDRKRLIEYAKEEERKSKKLPSAEDRIAALAKDQETLMVKYGSVSNLMLFASPDEMKRWADLSKATGLSEKQIHERLVSNVENWKSMLNSQTEELRRKFERDTLAGLTDDEKSAFRFWTSPSFGNINRYERYNIEVDPISKANAATMESAIKKAVIKEDVIARRGLDTISAANKMLEGVSGIDGWEDDPSILEGKSYIDKGFVGTTIAEKGGFGGHLKIFLHVPAGTHAVYIESISHAPLEKELLLQNGLEYRIIKAEYSQNMRYPDESDLTLWVEVLK